MSVLNDAVARLMVWGTPVAAALARARLSRRIAGFAQEQQRLRALYGIEPHTPMAGYDDATRARVHAFARAHPDARLATTSGSTGAPKEIAYTQERLRLTRQDNAACGVLAYARHRVRRPGMFILASLKVDDSFASLVLHGRGAMPPRLPALVEPARYLSLPRLQELTAEHGATATRLWLMIVSDPGMLYATNPSTIAAFVTDLTERWDPSVALLRRFVDGDLKNDATLRQVLRRVGSSGALQRLQHAARAAHAPPFAELTPGLTAWCAWDGGYTTAFLPVVHRALPPERFVHVPMYSMSTETIQTLTWFDDDGAARFLPLGPHVLYEFLPEGAEDRPELLLPATALEAGRNYSMVVSDPWGLLRYQTDDLFACRALVRGLPDLRFLRRRGLQYSFTGEKLTGEQLELAYAALRKRFPELGPGVELVCFPSQPTPDATPRYVLVVAPSEQRAVDVNGVAEALDAELRAMNREMDDKRHSGRLRAPVVEVVPHQRLAVVLDRRTENAQDEVQRAWESQFKLTPLSRKRWEEVAAALGIKSEGSS